MSVTTDRDGSRACNGHSQCLLCGERDPLSLKLAFATGDDGAVTATLRAHPGLQGYDGIVHGGVIAAVLDAAVTHCLFHHGVQAVTGDLHVRYVHPVAVDALLEVRAWRLSATPPLYRARAELRCDSRILAWTEAKLIERSRARRGERRHGG